MKPDEIKQIADAALAQAEGLLVSLFPCGERNGQEFHIGALDGHKGGSLSVNMRTGMWADFSTGDKGGDIVSLWAAAKNIKQGEAAEEIAGIIGAGGLDAKAAKGKASARTKRGDWIAKPYAETEVLAPTEHPRNVNGEWVRDAIAKAWAYRDKEGRLVGYICRVNYTDGSKDCFPYTYCTNSKTGESAWRWKGLAKPKPLYGLASLLSCKTGVCHIVEGEKKVDALGAIANGDAVVSWAGGAKSKPTDTDWSSIAGFRCILWPDADSQKKDGKLLPPNEQPGISAMLAVQDYIKSAAKSTFLCIPPADWKDGYDIADAIEGGWTIEDVIAHYKMRKNENDRLNVPVEEDLAAQSEPEPEREPEQHIRPVIPFRFLGYDNGTYYYLPDGTGQVIAKTAQQHTKLSLLDIASMDWFRGGQDDDVKIDWDAIADAMISSNKKVGVFDPAFIRGRGVWIDEGDVLLHLGNKLVVNGAEQAIKGFQSKYIYEVGRAIEYSSVKSITAKDDGDALGSAKLLDICEMLPWKHKLSAKLLAGWCVLGPICGILQWRPHVWISGPAGSGKTWALNNVILPLLGDMAVAVQSSSTEAGIRQKLRCDALPLVFDEAESEDNRGQDRMQRILELARQASAESGASIVKGTTGGESMEFKVRSMFCFASIGVAAVNEADKSRVTTLEFFKRNDVAAFENLKELWACTIGTEGYCDGIRSRALSLAITIRANCATFARACAVKIGDQRAGDQIGTLLAGAFSLASSRQISADEASNIIDGYDWSLFEKTETDSDEWRCWNRLLDAQIRTAMENGADVSSVGELIKRVLSFGNTDNREAARDILVRNGIKVIAEGERGTAGIYVVSDASFDSIARMFKDTQFTGKWKDQLARLPGAEPTSPYKFNLSSHRTVRVPLEIFG